MTSTDQAASGSSLLTELLEVQGIAKASDSERKALSDLLSDILRQSTASATTKVALEKVDALIAEVDRRMSDQVNEIMATAPFKSLESAWRGVKYLVDSIDFRENTRLELLSVSKDELREDFENAPDIFDTGLYNLVYRSALGQYGGAPYGVLCSTYDFGPGAEDVSLLYSCAAIANMAQAPFLANADPATFGLDSYEDIPRLKNIASEFEEDARYAQWRSFRASEDARYVGLCLPRFMLRLPYGQRESELKVRDFGFVEDVIGHHDRYVWGPASIALTANIASAFAKYRWCANIVGPQAGGAVERLPLHQYEQGGKLVTKNPCEAPVDSNKELTFAELGFISLVHKAGTDNAAFFSANSAQRPKTFGNDEAGKAAQFNHTLGTRLPYMFIVSRLSHYIKQIVTDKIGRNIERADLERELNDWIRQYVADMDNPHPKIRAERPLREAQVLVEDVPGQPGWYKCSVKVRPHLKFEGASFELSLVGRVPQT